MSRHTTRVGAGIIVGGLLAFGATVASREIMRRAGTRLIDWDAVREIAHRRLGEAGAPIPAAQRAEAEAFYRATLLRIEPIVAEEIGSALPEALETPAVVDRLQWVDLNLSTFRVLLDRVERVILDAQEGPDTTGRAVSRWVNRKVGNQQLGFMLAFLGRKVLGQYDVSLLPPDRPAAASTSSSRTSPPPPPRSACRATSSAPSSRSTRRPMRSSSRPTSGSGRTSPASWPRRSSSSPPSRVGSWSACARR